MSQRELLAAGPIVVLVEPQDLVNIASVVRLAKNFVLGQVRLVNPREFDPYRIEGIAHNTAEVVEGIGFYDSLEAALADCVYVVALTARGRAHKRTLIRPRAAAELLVEHADEGPVAFVLGREASGLTNAELDRCHALATIPTNPDHSSLNLAQACGILAYESMIARGGERQKLKPPRRKGGGAAKADQLAWLFADWQRALDAVEFFKTRQPDQVMRAFREMIYRAKPEVREAGLLRAMGIEIVRFLERKGFPVPPRILPETEEPDADG
ncbi:MAG: RNA methyltransferase [Gemmatimonadota bacterium]